MKIPQLKGFWKYEEHFKYGKSEGYVRFYVENDSTMAELNGREIVDDEAEFYYKETFSLSEKNHQPALIGVFVEFDDPDIDFYLDDWTIIHLEDNLIIAESNDDQGVSGTVILQKMADKKSDNTEITGVNILKVKTRKAS